MKEKIKERTFDFINSNGEYRSNDCCFYFEKNDRWKRIYDKYDIMINSMYFKKGEPDPSFLPDLEYKKACEYEDERIKELLNGESILLK